MHLMKITITFFFSFFFFQTNMWVAKNNKKKRIASEFITELDVKMMES